MNKPAKPMEGKPTKSENKPDNASTRDRQRGVGVLELLFAATTIGTTILVAAMNSSKKPPGSGD